MCASGVRAAVSTHDERAACGRVLVEEKATRMHCSCRRMRVAKGAASVDASSLKEGRLEIGKKTIRDSPTPQDERRDDASAVTRWLGNPVDPAGSICFIQGLSHACLSMNHTDGETANGSLQHLSSTRRHGPCVRYGYLMLTVELIRARTAFRGRHLLDSAQRMG